MRLISIPVIFAAALALAAFEAPGEAGAYASAPAQSVEACARICAEDTLCMAWTHAQNTCALRATVPANMSLAASGLSPRAPQSLRPAPITRLASAPEPTLTRPTPRVEPVETAMLLGGPDEETSGLRPSFGAPR